MFRRRPASASQAASLVMLLVALAAGGCQPPAPAGNAAVPPAPPGAPPPPPGAAPGPQGVERSGPAAASTPLDAAWSELIAVYEEQFNKLAGVDNESEAEAAVNAAVGFHRKRHAALTKIAGLGG